MAAAIPPSEPPTIKDLAQKSLQANKDHQYALQVYTERLEAELEAVDKLLAASEYPDDDTEVDAGGTIVVPGGMKAIGLIPYDRSIQNHPFAEEAERRHRYLQATVIHPMKAPELETLAEAVRAENHRIYALDAQKRGQQVFLNPESRPGTFLDTNKIGIDWERVASKVSAAGSSNLQRTPQECEIRWLGDRHPDFNHSDWSQPEIARLKELVGKAVEGQVDWVDIASRLGTNRTPLDCMRHAVPRRLHVWTSHSDKRLLDAVQIYGTGSWMLVARHVSEDATAAQCQNRYTRSLDPRHRRGTWSEEEDAQLRHAVEVFGRSWVEVCPFVPTRSSEQCRDRWQEVLNPGSGRGRWTSDEDKALLEAYRSVGEGRWQEISRAVGNGRSDNMCRHRYAALTKRQAKPTSTPEISNPPTPAPEGSSTGPSQERRVRDPDVPPDSIARDGPRTDASNITHCAVETPISTQAPKPKPKPRPRRCVAVEQGEVTVAERQISSTEVPADETIEPPEDQAVAQSAPKRRGRPRKHPVAPVAESGETGPPRKKRRTKSNEDSDRADAGGDVSTNMDVDPASPSEGIENTLGSSNKGKGRGIARVTTEPTRRSTRRRNDLSNNVAEPESTLNTGYGDIDSLANSNPPENAEPQPPYNEDPPGAGSSDSLEPGEPQSPVTSYRPAHASQSVRRGRGRARGRVSTTATTRTLRSASKQTTT